MARTVQDAQKLNGVSSRAITDDKGETVEFQAANTAITLRPALRGDHDCFDGGFRLLDEITPQTNTLLLLVTSGGNQVSLEFGMIPTVHPSAARALRKTSGWVLGWT